MTRITFIGGSRDGLTQDHALADGVSIVRLAEIRQGDKPISVHELNIKPDDQIMKYETYHIHRIELHQRHHYHGPVSTFVIAYLDGVDLHDVYSRLIKSYCRSLAKEG